tara:strand:- start:245 stop:400 length:156 start_codon:yes stop_codon:yes gene_type:complete
LLVPRSDGFVVSIDGTVHHKIMSAIQMVWLAQGCLRAASEMMNAPQVPDER